MQKYLGYLVIAVIAGYFFLGDMFTPARADLGAVLDRTILALTHFEKQVQKHQLTKLDEAALKQLEPLMQKAMNAKPPVYEKPVGVKLLKDASFQGFSDANGNNVEDAGDAKLFTVEIDFEGRRLIATGAGGASTGTRLASGLLGGMLLGSLMSNQRAAGVKPGAFANRKVQSRASYARSRARSGGRFGGK